LSKNTPYISRINYLYLTIGTVLLIFLINIIFTNWLGLIILIIASFLGIFGILSESRRINLMGSLILPAIIYYLT
ncbi:MAG: hypothetical protein MUF61_03300, partial [archaeon]|nr:hypothetical protein [archaeon]